MRSGVIQSWAPVVNDQLHASIQAELRHPPAEHVPQGFCVLTGHLLTDLLLAQHVVPDINIRHVAYKRVLVWDPQETISVLPKDKHALGPDSVAGLQVLLLPDQAIDPELGTTCVGRPGHAVISPVMGAQLVGKVDKLVADPQAHILAHGDDELIVIHRCGVGEDGELIAGLVWADGHACGEGLQAHRVREVSQCIAVRVAHREM